jgi:hypothetical protein
VTDSSWLVVVLYCDGSQTMHDNNQSHEPTPIAAYSRLDDGTWVPLHSAMFKGEDFTPRSGIEHFIGDDPVSEAQLFDELNDLGDHRTRYVWDCGRCTINEKRGDARLTHQIFDQVATWPQPEISLAQLVFALDEGTRRSHRNP